jgi:ABC-type branched-subunit amino acid transport system substrate-binding protein
MRNNHSIKIIICVLLSFLSSSVFGQISWQKINTGTSKTLWSVWGDSEGNVMAVGVGGTILYYYEKKIIPMDSGTNQHLCDIWGSDPNNIFAVGDNGTILRYDGIHWNEMESGSDFKLIGVWGTSSDNVYASGYDYYDDTKGSVLHFDGETWSEVYHDQERGLSRIWGFSENDIYVGGFKGRLVHFDGSNWQIMQSGSNNSLLRAWGDSPDNIYMAGYDGTILCYDGENWNSMDNIGTSYYFNDIWGDKSGKMIVVGNHMDSLILQFTGGMWEPIDCGSSGQKGGIWGDDKEIFICGNDGVILYSPNTTELLLSLEDTKNGDQFHFFSKDSSIADNTFYKGKWITGGQKYDCVLHYNHNDNSITITANHKNNDAYYYFFLQEASPSCYEGYYTYYTDTLYSGAVSLTTTYGASLEQSQSSSQFVSAKTIGQKQDNLLTIGALLPISGELHSLGMAFSSVLQLAHEDIQSYLADIGSELIVDLLIEDNQAKLSETWYRVQDLRGQGASLLFGPQDSPSLDYIKQFAEQENYLLLSSASTAVDLAIPDDNVMRCISDDRLQAQALVDTMRSDGITDIVILSRSNIYGRGLYQALEKGWADTGENRNNSSSGFMGDDDIDRDKAVSIVFGNNESDIDDVLVHLQNILNEESFEDKSKVGIVVIAYEEGITLFEKASAIEGLHSFHWYGTDSLAQDQSLIDNSIAAEFAVQTQFTCTTFAVPDSEAYQTKVDEVTTRLGYTPPTLAMIAYDTYQLAVRAYLEAGSDDPAIMKTALQQVAETYQGITGDLRFNENGDRATGSYAYWTVKNIDEQYLWQSDSGEIWVDDSVPVLDWAIME